MEGPLRGHSSELRPNSATSFREEPEVYEQLIPVVAETDGRHNTHWTTELSFYNPSAEAMSVEIRRLSNDPVNLW